MKTGFALLVGWLAVWPAAVALPALHWPAGTQVHSLSLTWFGAPLDVQVAHIPLSVAQAMDALIARADTPWQATVSGGRVVMAPEDDAWRLTLTAAGERTVATLSHMKLDQAHPLAIPSWLGAGWTVRAVAGEPADGRPIRAVDTASARGGAPQLHWVLTHPATPAQLRGGVAAGLQRAGWRQAGPLSDTVSHWHRDGERLRLVLVPLESGTGLSLHHARSTTP